MCDSKVSGLVFFGVSLDRIRKLEALILANFEGRHQPGFCWPIQPRPFLSSERASSQEGLKYDQYILTSVGFWFLEHTLLLPKGSTSVFRIH